MTNVRGISHGVLQSGPGTPVGSSDRRAPGRAVPTSRSARRGFWTPRSVMHMCSASSTTPTPLRLEVLVEPARDLRREPLLHLEVAREQVDDAGELREPDDPLARAGSRRGRRPTNGQQVVLAQRVERDGGRDDQLVVAAVVGERRRRNGCGVSSSAYMRATRRGVSRQALVGEVDAERAQQGARGGLGGGQVDAAAGAAGRRCQVGEGWGHTTVGAPRRRGLTSRAAPRPRPRAGSGRRAAPRRPRAGGRSRPRRRSRARSPCAG